MKKYKTIVVDPPREVKKVVQIGARTISVAESRLNWFNEFYERIEVKDVMGEVIG